MSKILWRLSIKFSWSLSLSKTSKHESTNSFSSLISLLRSSISSLSLKWYLVRLLTNWSSYFLFFGTGESGRFIPDIIYWASLFSLEHNSWSSITLAIYPLINVKISTFSSRIKVLSKETVCSSSKFWCSRLMIIGRYLSVGRPYSELLSLVSGLLTLV